MSSDTEPSDSVDKVEIDVSHPEDVVVQNKQQIIAVANELRAEYDVFDDAISNADKFDDHPWEGYLWVGLAAAPFVGWDWYATETLLTDWGEVDYDQLTRTQKSTLRRVHSHLADNYDDYTFSSEFEKDYEYYLTDLAVDIDKWINDNIGRENLQHRGDNAKRDIQTEIFSIKQRWKPSQYAPHSDEENVDSITGEQALQEFASAFDEEWEFIYPEKGVSGWRNVLYVYDSGLGIYRPRGQKFIEKKSEEFLGSESTNSRVNELVSKIRRRNTVDSWDMDGCEPSPFRLVCENGVVDLRTGEIDPYSPDEYHRTRIDVRYDPNAECPEVDDFIHSVLPDDDVDTLYRVIAHSLLREYVGSKAVLLVGDGRNGKSILLKLIEKFLSERNISGRCLQNITSDRWAPADLHGKLANVNGDMSEQEVKDVSTFKQVTGGDTLTGDVKYEQPVRFTNYATMIFASNGVPEMPDEDMALWRRWVYLNFPYTFGPNGDKEAEPRRQLINRITSDAELEGLLSKCVEEIKDWWSEGRDFYPDIGEPAEVRNRMKRASDPVFDFATECLIEVSPDKAESKKDMMERTEDVREVYRRYAKAENLPIIDESRFGDRILNHSDYDIDKQRVRQFEGSRTPAYVGITFSRKGEELLRYGSEEESVQSTSLDDDFTPSLPDRIGGVRTEDIREYIQANDGVVVDEVKDEFWIPTEELEKVEQAIEKWGGDDE